jgi:HAD superfamily hydrolase (TIGR01490 family)
MAEAAAFFDLDKTIIAKSSVLAFGKFFYREGLLSRRAIVRSAYAQVLYMLVGADESKMEEVREAMLAITRGWNQEHVASIVRETLDEVVTPIIYAEAVELIDEHKANGRKVVIVSSSPYEVVQPLARYLGADDAIATRAKLDADGNYTGELSFYAYGPHKASAIREMAARDGLDLGASYAYSDSITDVPLLEAVGHPVVVNPDRDLARHAREQGWEIRQFRRQVRLRDRMPMPPPAPTIALSTVVVAAGAGVAAWWWWRSRGPHGSPSTTATHASGNAHRARVITEGSVEAVRDTVGAIGATRRVATAWRRG